MRILLIDNYDSFTYNLVHYLEHFEVEVDVYRNDEIDLEIPKNYQKIVLSPGPGVPDQAGLLKTIIKEFAPQKSILGICLGQQAIAEVFGAKLKQLNSVVHGQATPIKITCPEELLYQNLPNNLLVGRYHSWVIDPQSMPESLQITAIDEEGEIMSITHKEYDVRAVQFHPESIMTPSGLQMIENWLKR